MVQVTPFALDNFIRQYKPSAQSSLHDTCVDPLSIQALAELADTSSNSPINTTTPIIYGSSAGNAGVREKILELYSDDVKDSKQLALIVTQGTIAANFLVLDTLIGPGDHVVCQYPTYQQLYEVPRRAGADVSLWRTAPENNWVPDMKQLASLVKENTKLIIINNPNNPTGASIPTPILEELVTFAAQWNITVLADEVFRPLFHEPSSTNPPSIISFADRYKNIIATSSVSKGFSLPGLRLGWIVSPNPSFIHDVNMARDYTTIAVSQIDQEIAAYALSSPIREKIVQRSLAICSRNLEVLGRFVAAYPGRLRWVRPTSASSAFVCIVDGESGDPVDDCRLCEELVREKGLLLVPGGRTFGTEGVDDFRGYLRLGFVCSAEKFDRALQLLGEYLDQRA